MELLGAIVGVRVTNERQTHTKRHENVKTFQMYKERRAKKQRKAKREAAGSNADGAKEAGDAQ